MEQLLDLVANATAGERLALVLFAAMALVAMVEDALEREFAADAAPAPAIVARLLAARALQRRAWRLIAGAAIAFSPFHAAWLIGRPAPAAAVRIGDLFASLAVERGISTDKIARGTWMNAAILAFLVTLACLTH